MRNATMVWAAAGWLWCGTSLAADAPVAAPKPPAQVSPTAVARKPAPRRARPAAVLPLLAKVQKTYAHHSYTAEFSQTYVDVATGPRSTETGTLQVTDAGKVRFAYAGKEAKLFVFDGNDAFFVEPEAAQVTKVANFAAGAVGEALAFLWGGGNNVDGFTMAPCSDDCPTTQAEGEQAITLRPKEAMPALARLDLTVDVRRAEVAGVRVRDALGNESRYLLSARRFDVPLDANAFAYAPPKDFSVVQALTE